MRLWTLHPKYLDACGLVALWREALLAQKVLSGRTKGYKRHPQLARFRASRDPGAAIASYLQGVLEEATARGYRFDAKKIARRRLRGPIRETNGQLLCEWNHLRKKLKRRDLRRFREQRKVKVPAAHPLFRIVRGGVRTWERTFGLP